MTALFAAPCAYCQSRNRPSPPLAPLWTVPTSEGIHADYLCPNPICGAGWYAMWTPDARTHLDHTTYDGGRHA